MAKRKRRAAKARSSQKNERLRNDELRLSGDRPTVAKRRAGAKTRTAAKRGAAKRHTAAVKRRTAAKSRTTRIQAPDEQSVEEFNDHPVGGKDALATDEIQ